MTRPHTAPGRAVDVGRCARASSFKSPSNVKGALRGIEFER